MRPVRLADVRSLVSQPDFQDWWGQLRSALDGLQQARARQAQLTREAAVSQFNSELSQKSAIDTLYVAGECEDAAATLNFEATEAENGAFQLVSQYEDLRIHVSDVWYRLGALEKTLEERRDAAGAPGAGKKAEEALKAVSKAHQACLEEYERLSERKRELWERVEGTWARQAETSLKMAEQKMRGKRIRSEAEARFQVAERLKQEAEKARADAESSTNEVSGAKASVARLLADAVTRFGCASGEEFLYFRQRDNASWAWAVALVEDGDSYNVEVHPLSIYSVEQRRGVTFLEPARDRSTSADEGDKRFEEYFLYGRKGRTPAVGA